MTKTTPPSSLSRARAAASAVRFAVCCMHRAGAWPPSVATLRQLRLADKLNGVAQGFHAPLGTGHVEQMRQ
jgi:hypothetical protein